MPLRVFEGSLDSLVLKDTSEQYLIFYSSIVDGVLWCPDCRDVEDVVKQVFGPQDGPSGLIVYAGDRAEWRSPSNVLRKEPWKVTNLPTILRTKDNVRLVESEVINGLPDFVMPSLDSRQP